MAKCFVIQPFDAGKFDKRFEDVFKPAIEAAGLEAYRVDQDPRVDVAIEAIEEGIRSASICLADITTDNPNVWYELGFAFAVGRPVVMVCSKEREDKKYPFDIQHRTIITYSSESSSDFDKLGHSITTRLKAQLTKAEAFRQIEQTQQISPIEGLSQPELFVLAEIAGGVTMPDSDVPLWSIKSGVEKAGLTALGFSLGIRRLKAKGFVELKTDEDYNGNQYEAAHLNDRAWGWIEKNEKLFVIRRPEPELDDTIPF